MDADKALVIDDSEDKTTIESNARGLVYVFEKNLNRVQPRIGIGGLSGLTYVDVRQARALVAELPELIELYC